MEHSVEKKIKFVIYIISFSTQPFTRICFPFFFVNMYLDLNCLILKHVRYLHLSPLYPDEHPFKQFPLIKWHWSSRKQCPHSWRQLGPKVPEGHSYNAMNVILKYYSFWIVFIFCNKLMFKLNFNFFQNTYLNCSLCQTKNPEWVYPVVIQKVHLFEDPFVQGSIVRRHNCQTFTLPKVVSFEC